MVKEVQQISILNGAKRIPLKLWYVPIFALLFQSLLIRLHGADIIPELLLRVGVILSYLALFAMISMNFRLTGIRIIALGILLNFAVIAANGGLMPVSPDAAAEISQPASVENVELGSPVPNSKDIVLERDDTALWWLSDVFTATAFDSSWGIAFSIGDIVIALGLLYLIISALSGLLLKSRRKNLAATVVH